ncbi:uncharacterized protein LOC131816706 [Mustela lutreola]|uniref:uncharacterized protein LOC131816706 n=1 Tax=Mustela lutreola TaxID=9666 RepID=UPI00279714BA|nr:uncharacterized protein LOC131816706 [Mustela lutreola]
MANFAHFNKYLEKLFNSSLKSKDTKKSKNVKNPKKAANATKTPPANTGKPPQQSTGKPQPPPSSQGPRQGPDLRCLTQVSWPSDPLCILRGALTPTYPPPSSPPLRPTIKRNSSTAW